MGKKEQRKRYFVEAELQFWFVLILILVASIEGIFVGWGISRLFAIAADWQRTQMPIQFFKTLILILFPLIGVNFILGIYFSHKLAGPLFRARKALREIREGSLAEFRVRQSDVFKDFFREFNETILILSKLVHRDQELIKKALAQLDKCQEILYRKHSIKELKEVQKMFLEIKSFLVTVGSHFRASPHFSQKEKDAEEENNSDRG